jgi:hypothetical protein
VLLYPYGIVVDSHGRRFFDEGGGLVHETWEKFSRHIHFAIEGKKVFAISPDKRRCRICGWGCDPTDGESPQAGNGKRSRHGHE